MQMNLTKNVNQSELQYNAIRQLLQCGHAYATLESYEKAFRMACKNFEHAGTDIEEVRWELVCEAVNAVAEMLFEDDWISSRRQICRDTMAPLIVKNRN